MQRKPIKDDLFGQQAVMPVLLPEGIGERLDPAPALPECGLVLVNPGVAVATADVFRTRRAGFSPPAALPDGC